MILNEYKLRLIGNVRVQLRNGFIIVPRVPKKCEHYFLIFENETNHLLLLILFSIPCNQPERYKIRIQVVQSDWTPIYCVII